MEMNEFYCGKCLAISQCHWSSPVLVNKPKKFDFVHQISACCSGHQTLSTVHTRYWGSGEKTSLHDQKVTYQQDDEIQELYLVQQHCSVCPVLHRPVVAYQFSSSQEPWKQGYGFARYCIPRSVWFLGVWVTEATNTGASHRSRWVTQG